MSMDAQKLLEQLRRDQAVQPVSEAQAALDQLRQGQPAPQPESDDSLRLGPRQALQQAAKGLSFGFSDEITAALTAPLVAIGQGIPVSEAFRDVLEAERFEVAQIEEAFPVASTALQIGGGLATGGAGATRAAGAKIFQGAATRGGQIAQKVGSSAAAGVPAGALFGAGTAEGGLGERVQGAAEGAAIGAVGGALLQPVVAASTVALKAVPRVIRAAVRSLTKTDEKVANARIAQKLLKDDSVASVRQSIKELGEGATIADAPGEAIKIELERVASSPGSRNQVVKSVTEKLDGSRGRIASDVREKFTPGNLTFEEHTAAINKAASEVAEPFYAVAYATPVDNSAPALKKLLGNSRIAKAMKQAVKDIKDETLDEADPNIDALRRLQAEANAENPNLMVWDFTKRELDDVQSAAFSKGRGTRARAIGKNLKQLRDTLDEQVPEYGQARKIWAGGKEAESAFVDGTEVLDRLTQLKTGAAASVKRFDDLSDAGKAQYTAGVGQSIENTVLTTGDDATASLANRIAGNPAKRTVLRNVIPDEAGRKQFIRSLESERDFAKNGRELLAGSRSTLRASLKDADKTSFGTIASNLIAGQFALSGNQFAQLRLVSSLAGKAGGASDKVNRAIGRKLTATRGAEISRTLDEIDRLIRLPKSLKEAQALGPADVVKFFLDSPEATRKFNETAAAVTAAVLADKRNRERE